MKLSDYAEERGVTYRTAWNRFNRGLIPGAVKDPLTGAIHISKSSSQTSTKSVALYARVSSNEHKENLIRQLSRLTEFATASGYVIRYSVKEIGSGVNDSRQKLMKLLEKPDWDVLVVEHKDRLTRFGFNYIEKLLNVSGKRIEVINPATDEKSDLIQDMISVLYSFSARMYSRRKTKREKIKELINQLP